MSTPTQADRIVAQPLQGARPLAPSRRTIAVTLVRLSLALGVAVALVGAGHLVAWMTGAMAGRGQGALTMKTNASLCLLLLGVGLTLDAGRPGRWRRLAVVVLAVPALVIGLLTLGENLFGWDFGIDQALMAEPQGALGVQSPNRMGTPGSLSMALAAASLLLLCIGRPRAVRAAQAFAIAVLAIALLPTVGHIYGARSLYEVSRITAIAWPTALSLVTLAVGLLCARPTEGPMAQVSRSDAGGASFRRMIAPTLLVPVVVGWLHLTGVELGLFDVQLGTAILVLAFVTSFSVLLYASSRHVSESMVHLHESRLAAERAKAAAEDASRAKDQFIAVLSHELRTPLTPVLTGLALLEDEDGLSPHGRDRLALVRRNVELEARLIDDLLDTTRIARGKVELDREKVELCKILGRAIDVCRPDIDARRLQLSLDYGSCPYVLEGDEARLQQVFWNLLKNAAKFTPPGGQVAVRCRPEHGHVVVEVEDSGQGIDPAFARSVFDAFFQAPASARPPGGLGLGLTVSRALVQLHGGTISAQSEGHGKGTTFVVRLPILAYGEAAARERTGPQAVKAAARSRRLRVLVVEDHADSAEMLASVLDLAGHETKTAPDVATALEALGGEPFDVLVSDLGLPDRSGLELMRTLRGEGNALPSIALSGYGQEADVEQSLAAGFQAHLVKPVEPRKLIEAIEKVARRA